MTETQKYAKQLTALASEQRLEIVRLLMKAGPEGMCVGDIQKELGIPNSTLSHHLEKLRQEAIVNARKEKQWVHHSIDFEVVGRLVSYLCARCYRPERLSPLFTQIRKECVKTKESPNVLQ